MFVVIGCLVWLVLLMGCVCWLCWLLAYMLVGMQSARSKACCAAGWGLGRNVVVGGGGGLLV